MANQRALPYSTPRRYFLAFLLLQYTIRRNATAPATPTARSNRWKLGAALSKAREKPSARCNSFSDKSAQPPAGRLSQLAEQVNKQQIGQVGDYQLFHFRLHRDSPLSLIFSLACWPWCSVFLPLARCCRYFFSAACSTWAVSLPVFMDKAMVFWVTSSGNRIPPCQKVKSGV